MKKNYVVRLMLIVAGFIISLQMLYAEVTVTGTMPDNMKVNGVWYVLYDTPERGFWIYNSRLEDDKSETIYTWEKGPSDVLTFDARRNPEKKYNLDVYKGANGTFGSSSIWSEMPGLVTETETKKDWLGNVTIKEKAVEYVSYPQNGQDLRMERSTRQIRFASKYNNTSRKNEMFVRNVKVTMARYLELTDPAPSDAVLNFDETKYVAENSTSTAEISFQWCNVSDIEVTLSDTKHYTIDNADISDLQNIKEGSWGTATISVIYSHAEGGEHPAELTIKSNTDSEYTFTVTLNGKTKKYDQTITWWTEDEPAYLMATDLIAKQDIATSPGGQITYAIDETNYLSIENDYLTPHVQSTDVTAIITATQAGDKYWNSITETKEVIITTKQRQTINWADDFSNIAFTTPAPTFDLTAVSSAALAITYSSSNTDVAEIVDGKLYIKQVGNAIITATAAGNNEYLPASAIKYVFVHSTEKNCEDVIYEEGPSDEILSAAESKEYVLDGEPGLMTFEAKAKDFSPGITPKGDFKLCVYKDGAWDENYFIITEDQFWVEEKGEKVNNIFIPFSVILDKNVTRFKFKATHAQGCYHIWEDVKILRARYVEATPNPVEFSQTMVGATDKREVTIKYSNIPHVMNITKENPNSPFSVDAKSFGSVCGEQGDFTLTVTFAPTAEGTFTDKLIIKDEDNVLTYEIILQGTATPQIFDNPTWLAILPEKDGVGGDVIHKGGTYQNLLFAENGNDYAELLSENSVTIEGELNYMFTVTAADDWRSFVAPFNVDKAYVIETVKEEDNRATMEKNQPAANAALYKYLTTELITEQSTATQLVSLIQEYLKKQSNASDLGIYDITSNYFYLHEAESVWGVEGNSVVKSWTELESVKMAKGKTYVMSFPWCPYCEERAPWDYWTGKIILLQGRSTEQVKQTVDGRNVTTNPAGDLPTNTAKLKGNYTLADMSVDANAWVHDTSDDIYRSVGSSSVKPTASFLYANILPKQNKPAIGILRTGEIIWEGEDVDDNNSGTVTGVEQIAGTSIYCVTEVGGFSLYSAIAQPIAIYTVNGVLVYTGEIAAAERKFFALDPGLYLVRTPEAVAKIIAK